MNVSHWDYIPFSKWESYDYDAIPMGLFESATLWLKLDTHAQFDPRGNMSNVATSARHAYVHRFPFICIFQTFVDDSTESEVTGFSSHFQLH